jgi:hypothetical protein
VEILSETDLPDWLKYPREYLWLVEYGVVKFPPWYLLDSRLARLRYDGLQERYPDRKLFAFAARGDNDDIACWQKGDASAVIVIHDFASKGYLRPRTFPSFWDWFRAAIEDMIQFEP